MTQKVSPSVGHRGSSFEATRVISQAAASDGWIYPNTEASPLSLFDNEIADGPFNSFEFSSAGLTYTIDSGEGFVYGAWVADDQQRTIETTDPGGLNANDADQIIYLGWAILASDRVKIGTASAFNELEPKIPIYQVSTSSTAVTSFADLRPIGRRLSLPNEAYDYEFGGTRKVSESQNTQRYKGIDIDTNGDGVVNNASNVTGSYKGNDIDTDGDGKVNSANTADSATTATSADTLYGYTPSQIARGSRTVNFPVAEMQPGDTYSQVERIMNNEVFRLLGSTVLTKSGGDTSYLEAFVKQAGASSDLYTDRSHTSSGSLPNPLTQISGPLSLSIGIRNNASSTTYDASARFTYFMEP